MQLDKIRFHAKTEGHKFHDRDDLTIEHPMGDKGQLYFAILFISLWILDSFVFRYSTVLLSNIIPIYIRIPIASLLLIPAVYFPKVGMDIVFGEVRDPPTVIKKGPFLRIRHPVYLGEILLYIGLFILTLSLISLVVIIPVWIFMNSIAKYEEKKLVEKFGEEYLSYMDKVPRWFVLIKPASFE